MKSSPYVASSPIHTRSTSHDLAELPPARQTLDLRTMDAPIVAAIKPPRIEAIYTLLTPHR
jgi:hypothetical protein